MHPAHPGDHPVGVHNRSSKNPFQRVSDTPSFLKRRPRVKGRGGAGTPPPPDFSPSIPPLSMHDGGEEEAPFPTTGVVPPDCPTQRGGPGKKKEAGPEREPQTPKGHPPTTPLSRPWTPSQKGARAGRGRGGGGGGSPGGQAPRGFPPKMGGGPAGPPGAEDIGRAMMPFGVSGAPGAPPPKGPGGGAVHAPGFF